MLVTSPSATALLRLTAPYVEPQKPPRTTLQGFGVPLVLGVAGSGIGFQGSGMGLEFRGLFQGHRGPFKLTADPGQVSAHLLFSRFWVIVMV